MDRIINEDLRRLLTKDYTGNQLIQTLLTGMWRGETLLSARIQPGNSPLFIRLQGMNCLPAFTSADAADAFGRMLAGRGGPQIAFCGEGIAPLADMILQKEDGALAIDPGSPWCAILPGTAAEKLISVTSGLTGGRTPDEDLPLMRLHMGTVGNRSRVLAAQECGCFRCVSRFPASEVRAFTTEEDGRRTALCPRCGVDAVLTDREAIPLDDSLLAGMNRRFFGPTDSGDGVMIMLYMQAVRERIAREDGARGK